MWQQFTVTLTDGSTIADDSAGGPTDPAHLSVEPYGVEIQGNVCSNRRYIPWHRINDVTVGPA